ncbi:hypothetical protein PLESTB_000945600 [Pleodorina starrii]|uniref:Uncharacterized protein n=1 Tax=Pleodorina starrii TaxID=330485 RepID=A0A9W6BPG8_9CHLO|nr:hypothetical protein PLESTB_000945600 [Pleodorina starrii]
MDRLSAALGRVADCRQADFPGLQPLQPLQQQPSPRFTVGLVESAEHASWPRHTLPPISSLPDEIWALVLARSGLRSCAQAAACSAAFRDLHRTVASTPVLLARALLVDHGLSGAAAILYDSSAGKEPSARHAVHSDAGVAAAFRELFVLAAPPGVAAAAAAAAAATAVATATAAVVKAEEEERSEAVCDGDGAAAGTRKLASTLACVQLSPALTHGWDVGWVFGFRQVAGELLCAAAAAGHVQVAATALALGATALDRALLEACAAAAGSGSGSGGSGSGSGSGRGQVVRLLLARGADPNAAEAFGPGPLFKAAQSGKTDVVRMLLDAGARIDGAGVAVPPYNVRDWAVEATAAALRLAAPPPPPAMNAWRQWPTISGVYGNGAAGAIVDVLPSLPPLRVPPPPAAAAFPPLDHRAVAAAAPLGAAPGAGAGGFESRVSSPQQIEALEGLFGVPAAVAPGVAVGRSAAAPAAAVGTASTTSVAATAAAVAVFGTSSVWDTDSDDEDVVPTATAATAARPVGSADSQRTPDRPFRAVSLQPPPCPRKPPPLSLSLRTPLPDSRAPLPLLPLLPPLPPLPPSSASLPPLIAAAAMPPLPGPGFRLGRSSKVSPLLAACQAGHAATAALLLRRGAQVDGQGGTELAQAGSPHVVDELLAAVPDLRTHLDAALVAAASDNRLAVVSALLRHGADAGHRSGLALQEAAFLGHSTVVETLLRAGGAGLRSSGALRAVLEMARCWCRPDIVQLLADATRSP